jgi:ribonucleotide reductase alpha subunit
MANDLLSNLLLTEKEIYLIANDFYNQDRETQRKQIDNLLEAQAVKASNYCMEITIPETVEKTRQELLQGMAQSLRIIAEFITAVKKVGKLKMGGEQYPNDESAYDALEEVKKLQQLK